MQKYRKINLEIFCNCLSKCDTRYLSYDKFLVTEDIIKSNFQIGSFAQVEHTFSQSKVNSFAAISGDNNPLHSDPEYASKSRYGGTIVHGILVSSLFSMLLGSLTKSIYVNQSLNFSAPVHVGTTVVARIEVIKSEKKRSGVLLTCTTKAYLPDRNNEVAIHGEAKVLLPIEFQLS